MEHRIDVSWYLFWRILFPRFQYMYYLFDNLQCRRKHNYKEILEMLYLMGKIFYESNCQIQIILNSSYRSIPSTIEWRSKSPPEIYSSPIKKSSPQSKQKSRKSIWSPIFKLCFKQFSHNWSNSAKFYPFLGSKKTVW